MHRYRNKIVFRLFSYRFKLFNKYFDVELFIRHETIYYDFTYDRSRCDSHPSASEFCVARSVIDNRPKSDYGGKYVSVIAWLSLGGAVGVNARMHIQNGAPHILVLTY
jgi:hypothetical protein